MSVGKAVEAAGAELRPLMDLVSFAQRRAVALRDAVAVCEEGLLRFHDVRQPAPSPGLGYPSLVHPSSLEAFLRSAVRGLRAMPRRDRASFRFALAFHRCACAQEAEIYARLVEHLSALDWLATLVGHPRKVKRPSSAQLEHWKDTRQRLRQSRWPATVLPRPRSLDLLRKVRNDLAHPRLCRVLRPASPEHSKDAVLRATEICVTLLEVCALKLLGLSPSGPPRLWLFLPFRFSCGQRVSIGQQ